MSLTLSNLQRRITHLQRAGILHETTARYILEGRIQVKALPRIDEIENMKHTKLIRVLRYCPESPWFYDKKETLNMQKMPQKKARRLVEKLVLAYITLPSAGKIDEVSAINEAS